MFIIPTLSYDNFQTKGAIVEHSTALAYVAHDHVSALVRTSLQGVNVYLQARVIQSSSFFIHLFLRSHG